MTALLNIRQRRQVTFPEPLLGLVGVSIGDNLVAEVLNNQIVLKPQKQKTLDLFSQLQGIIADSGVSNADLQNAADEDRKVWAKNYASQESFLIPIFGSQPSMDRKIVNY